MLIDGAELTKSVTEVAPRCHVPSNVTDVRHNPSHDFQFVFLAWFALFARFVIKYFSRMPFNCKLLDKELSFGSLKSLALKALRPTASYYMITIKAPGAS